MKIEIADKIKSTFIAYKIQCMYIYLETLYIMNCERQHKN